MANIVEVSGPISYSRIEYQDKIIHNFGDVHVKSTKCKDSLITLRDIIDTTVKEYKDDIIDIFIESGGSTAPVDLVKGDSHLSDLIFYFDECYETRTVKCNSKYPNVRFHTIDLREIMSTFLRSYGLTYAKSRLYIKQMYRDSDDIYGLHTHIRNILNNQYQHIKDKSIVDQLEMMYLYVIKTGPLIKDHERMNIDGLMDIYLLARLLRTYDTSKRQSFRNENVTKAIIYSGRYHSYNYDNFFKSIGGKIYSESGHIFGAHNLKNQCIFVPVKQGTLSLSFEKGYHVEIPKKGPENVQDDPGLVAYKLYNQKKFIPIRKLHDDIKEQRIINLSPRKKYYNDECGFIRIDGSKCKEAVISSSSCMEQSMKCPPKRCEKHSFTTKEVPYDYIMNLFHKIKLSNFNRTFKTRFNSILIEDKDIINSIEPKYTQFDRLVNLVQPKAKFTPRINFNLMFLDFILNKFTSFIKSFKIDYNKDFINMVHESISENIFLKYIYAAETSYDAKLVLEVAKICPKKIWSNALSQDPVMFNYIKLHQKPDNFSFKKWVEFQKLNVKITNGEHFTKEERDRFNKLTDERNTWIFSNLKEEPVYIH